MYKLFWEDYQGFEGWLQYYCLIKCHLIFPRVYLAVISSLVRGLCYTFISTCFQVNVMERNYIVVYMNINLLRINILDLLNSEVVMANTQ